MRTTNLFVIANVKQLRTGGSFRILLPFLQTFCGVGVLNSAIFNSFQIGLSSERFWRAFGISGGGEEGSGLNPPNHPLGTPLSAMQLSVTLNIICCMHRTNVAVH